MGFLSIKHFFTIFKDAPQRKCIVSARRASKKEQAQEKAYGGTAEESDQKGQRPGAPGSLWIRMRESGLLQDAVCLSKHVLFAAGRTHLPSKHEVGFVEVVTVPCTDDDHLILGSFDHRILSFGNGFPLLFDKGSCKQTAREQEKMKGNGWFMMQFT
jgi:hypothetical protein